MNILTWQPSYLIKSYPELQALFSRGENHLLAYLHNWTYQLARKGKEAEWIHLTQRQIAEAIDYSVSSVKRFIRQCNQKLSGVIETRSRRVWLTKNFYYTVTEYRINWSGILLAFVSQQNNQIATTAQSSHCHFKLPLVSDELSLVQDEPPYKDQLKDLINKKTSLNTLREENSTKNDYQTPDNSNCQDLDYSTTLLQNKKITVNKANSRQERFSAMLTSQNAAAMGLILTTDSQGNKAWTPNPAGRMQSRSAWINQGIALELWANKDMAIDFQGQVTKYAKNQVWCKSPLDYTNSIIKGLLAGDNPKADRYWEAWHNGYLIGWENLFDWEVQPGVINPAFLNWVETSLFDSTKPMAANAAAAAKEIKFNVRELWARFQRVIAREVENAQAHSDRGQAYLPSGALLPRTDQPTSEQTHQALNYLTEAASLVKPLLLTAQTISAPLVILPEVTPEVTAEEFIASHPDKADILAKMERIGGMNRIKKSPADMQGQPSSVSNLLNDNTTATDQPLAIKLLPQIFKLRSTLEKKHRRCQMPYDLAKAAKYLIWAEHGDEVMQMEASEWLKLYDLVGSA